MQDQKHTALTLYPIVMADAAAFRATGHRTKAGRESGHAIPLGKHVTEDVAHDAFCDSIIWNHLGEWPSSTTLFDVAEGLSDRRGHWFIEPSTIGLTFGRSRTQTGFAALSPTLAVCGDDKGKTVTVSMETVKFDEPSAVDHSLTEAEAREAMMTAIAKLPKHLQDTCAILLKGARDKNATIRSMCPESIGQSAWRSRVATAREAMRIVLDDRRTDKMGDAVAALVVAAPSYGCKPSLGNPVYGPGA